MNPFNLLINYVIANSRASYYNVPGNQEVTNMALLTGMISENPLLSYLIIDNKAKSEGENVSSSLTILNTPVTHGIPALPAATSGTSQTPIKEDPKKETALPGEEAVTIKNLETFKNEITTSNKDLEDKILKELSGLKDKLESFDKEKIAINASIATIEKRLDEIVKPPETHGSQT
ncbi:hypothetical protein [Flavobacterium aquidurense]|uniref:Uncharacterized protein n=1 Tax=Flavobacterium aquidurense TaxID=362413 RepID=A0A0Q0RYI0_9FLAO|nr:hypothetical protein [Flavobacterium aquidurense]KQB42478.1 hypothetical protein RC62_3484 [Flavobacterium aquidurense]